MEALIKIHNRIEVMLQKHEKVLKEKAKKLKQKESEMKLMS